MDEPLFCISNIWRPLCPKHICCVTQRVTECQIFIQFYFSYTSPSANMYRFSIFDDLSVWLEVWILLAPKSPHNLHKCSGPAAAQHPDLSWLKGKALVLVMQCPTLLYFHDVMGNIICNRFSDTFFGKSSTAQFFIFVFSIVKILFATFVSQREDYILTLLECVFKFVTKMRANLYAIWFIRDTRVPIGLHTALCSRRDQFSPKHKVYCLSTWVYKCPLFLTSYFSKKIVVWDFKKERKKVTK